MCVMVMECKVQYREMCYGIGICNVCNGDGGVWYSIEKCVMVSVYVMCVMVMEFTVQYREMCFGISICNVSNGDGV